jgi:AcrR family transcriptional regulator
MAKQHHHGNLRETLINAGLALLQQNGVDGLSIRKVAALAGVSHAAPAHHFATLTDLRTAVIATGYRTFADRMLSEIAQIEPNDALAPPRDRILAAFRGYAAFAADNPALFQMMFGGAERKGDDPDLNAAAGAAMDVLRDICAPIVRRPGEAADTNELMIWSLVHGFASLALTDNSGRLDITDSAQLTAILPPLQFTSETNPPTKELE